MSFNAMADLAAVLPPGAVSVAESDCLAVSTNLGPRHLLALQDGIEVDLPAAVVWPESTADIQQTLLWAQRTGTTVVPYGAGSSPVEGLIAPTDRSVILDLKRMAQLVEVDAAERTATAQAGILGELFERELERRGYMQGHFPESIYCSTLGGWAAAGSSGQLSGRFGNFEEQVVGGTVVLKDATVAQQRSSPLAGSFARELQGLTGAPGIWSDVTVRIHDLPEQRSFRGLEFPDLTRAIRAARSWMESGLAPAVLRIGDPVATLLQRLGNDRPVPHDRGSDWRAHFAARFPVFTGWATNALARSCFAVIGVQGSRAAAKAQMAGLLDLAVRAGGRDLGPEPGDLWYRRRYAHSYRQSNAFRAGVAVDILEVACPWDRALGVYQAMRHVGLRAGAHVLAHFSHAFLDRVSICFTFAFLSKIGLAGYECLLQTVREAARSHGADASLFSGAASINGFRFLRPFGKRSLVADVETTLRRFDETLGPAAQLFESWTVEDAGSHGFLWRVNPQLRVLESLVATMAADVSAGRVWLRTEPRSVPSWTTSGPAVAMLELARTVVRDDDAGPARAVLVCDSTGATVRLVPGMGRSAEQTFEQLRLLLNDGQYHLTAAGLSGFSPLRGEPMFVAGPWRVLGAWLNAVTAEKLVCTLPWMDSVGAAGFVHRPDMTPPDTDTRSRLMALAAELGLSNWVTRSPIPLARRASGTVGLAEEMLQLEEPPLPLVLKKHHAALSNCTYCPKMCRFACPVAVAAGSETLTPRQMMLTCDLDRNERRAFTPGIADRLWSCVDCRGCRTFCDHDNDVASVLVEARAELFRQEAVPERVLAVIRSLEKTGRLPDRPVEDDAALAVTGDGVESEAWLFLGCQGSRQDPEPARAALALARARFGKVHVPTGLGCCGHPLWRWGAHLGFGIRARTIGSAFSGVRWLVVDDPGCAYTLRVLYPQAGVPVPQIVTLTELLNCSAWRLPAGGTWAPHDSCFSTRYLNEPCLRCWLASQGSIIAAGSVLEGEAGSCGGALLPFYDPALAQKVVSEQVRDLLASGAQRILTSSPTCRRRLRSAGAPVDDVATLWLRSQSGVVKPLCGGEEI